MSHFRAWPSPFFPATTWRQFGDKVATMATDGDKIRLNVTNSYILGYNMLQIGYKWRQKATKATK
jgi:hypothetical protein